MRSSTPNYIGLLVLSLGVYNCKNDSAKTGITENEFKHTRDQPKIFQINKTIGFSMCTLNTKEGKSTKTHLDKRKTYILDFCYMECAPGVKDHKVIAKYVDSLKQKNIEVVGMSIYRSLKKWNHYLNKNDYSWTNYNQFRLESNLYKDLKIQRFQHT
jgi:hypothetical protein